MTSQPMPPRRIAVVGGGLAGLEVAVAAAEGGSDVEVFEPGPRTRTRHVYWDTTIHAGDEKTRSWTSEGWAASGGLSERLGGRSLCYHGVLLGLEPNALASWDPVWARRLAGGGGLYASVLDGLRADFPELVAKEPYPELEALGLRHVAQAARLDDAGRFEAYGPLARTLELAAAGRIRLTRARAHAVASEPEGCAVQIERPSGTEWRRGFDACVLASSAVGNVQLLAASLGRDITTSVTDHFCVGAIVRLPPGPPLTPFRHAMLWSGFVPLPEIGTNLFFLERPPLASGDRIVELNAVVEQQGELRSFSELSVQVLPDGMRSHIRARVSDASAALVDAARGEVRRWAERLAGGAVTEVVRDPSRSAARGTASWSDHREALEAIAAAAAGAFCEYEVPYGAFEHEACTHPIGVGGPVPVTPDLEVVELPGVHVAGPGAFPRLGAANPALTIIAMSRWLGERVGRGKVSAPGMPT
ncbi:NAD-binding protein [Glycomyces niveus]|uniref:NAD-binding protein n=1 Tax=Glycomyces niveus TaxID=2820287 RepID=A0ABS3U2W3_9ACTN|nr:NAD-binding protein [Glycomyces sp. NEAU-S30]MBO3733109.1 NAD-binding protein [Glycomyces sp. NEAU-S30]